jgi:hypothetical protein
MPDVSFLMGWVRIVAFLLRSQPPALPAPWPAPAYRWVQNWVQKWVTYKFRTVVQSGNNLFPFVARRFFEGIKTFADFVEKL